MKKSCSILSNEWHYISPVLFGLMSKVDIDYPLCHSKIVNEKHAAGEIGTYSNVQYIFPCAQWVGLILIGQLGKLFIYLGLKLAAIQFNLYSCTMKKATELERII